MVIEKIVVAEKQDHGIGFMTNLHMYDIDSNDPLRPLIQKGRYVDVVPKSIETSELTIYDKDQEKKLGHGLSKTGVHPERLNYLEFPQEFEKDVPIAQHVSINYNHNEEMLKFHKMVSQLPIVIELKNGVEREFLFIEDYQTFNSQFNTPFPEYKAIEDSARKYGKAISFEELREGSVMPAQFANNEDGIGYTYYRFSPSHEFVPPEN